MTSDEVDGAGSESPRAPSTDDLTGDDRALLRLLQKGLPVESHPYATIASALEMTEELVVSRIGALQEAGFIRKVGAVLAPKHMGYVSTLAAVNVPDDNVDGAATIISGYPGVTHNYLREEIPNVWFTLTEPSAEKLDTTIREMESRLEAPVIRLPVERLFRIGVQLDV